MDGIAIVLLNDLVLEIGEEATNVIISDFSCPLNQDVEIFLKEKAMDFGKKRYSQTYLVFMSHKKQLVLVGYYCLANKTIEVPKRLLNAAWKRRISRFSTFNSMSNTYALALPLIGQLGKNYKYGYDQLISGDIGSMLEFRTG